MCAQVPSGGPDLPCRTHLKCVVDVPNHTPQRHATASCPKSSKSHNTPARSLGALHPTRCCAHLVFSALSASRDDSSEVIRAAWSTRELSLADSRCSNCDVLCRMSDWQLSRETARDWALDSKSLQCKQQLIVNSASHHITSTPLHLADVTVQQGRRAEFAA